MKSGTVMPVTCAPTALPTTQWRIYVELLPLCIKNDTGFLFFAKNDNRKEKTNGNNFKIDQNIVGEGL